MLRQVSGSAPILFRFSRGRDSGRCSATGEVSAQSPSVGPGRRPCFSQGGSLRTLHEASLLWLTLETAFLLALALARRSSELVSISGFPNVIGFSLGGSVS